MNLLMVDDDALFLEKLQETVSFKKLGIDVVFSAANIRQAIQILEEYPIEIVLSDIEMPKGSGLELLQWIRSQEMEVECIFLSSYAYFAYAQKAIALKSSEYLLKPVSNRELEKVLETIVAKVQKTRGEEKKGGVERDCYWKELLSTGKQPAVTEGSLDEVLLLMVECVGAIKANDRKFLHYCMEHLEEPDCVIVGEAPAAVWEDKENCWILIYQDQEATDAGRRLAGALREGLERKTGCFLFFYAALTRPGMEAVECKDRLSQLLEHAILDRTGILWLKDWERKNTIGPAPSWDIWESEAVETDSILSARDEILRYLDEIFISTRITKEWMRGFRRSLMQMIYNCLKRQNAAVGSIFGDEEFDRGYETSERSMEDMKQFVFYLMDKLHGYNSQDNRQESVVKQIQNYVAIHFREELSRKKLSALVYLSEDYVSKLFAGVTGMSLTAYITSIRMEKAKEYLEKTAHTVSETAMEVGYTNFSYFSKNFKDYTGYTPNEFREWKRKHK